MYHYQLGISASEHDDFVIQSDQTNLLQSSSWAKIKDNWGNERVGFYQEDQLVAVASILIQPLPLGFSMLYIPRGPIMDYQNKELVSYVIQSLKKIAKQYKALFVKFDPSLFLSKHLIGQEQSEAPAVQEVIDRKYPTTLSSEYPQRVFHRARPFKIYSTSHPNCSKQRDPSPIWRD